MAGGGMPPVGGALRVVVLLACQTAFALATGTRGGHRGHRLAALSVDAGSEAASSGSRGGIVADPAPWRSAAKPLSLVELESAAAAHAHLSPLVAIAEAEERSEPSARKGAPVAEAPTDASREAFARARQSVASARAATAARAAPAGVVGFAGQEVKSAGGDADAAAASDAVEAGMEEASEVAGGKGTDDAAQTSDDGVWDAEDSQDETQEAQGTGQEVQANQVEAVDMAAMRQAMDLASDVAKVESKAEAESKAVAHEDAKVDAKREAAGQASREAMDRAMKAAMDQAKAKAEAEAQGGAKGEAQDTDKEEAQDEAQDEAGDKAGDEDEAGEGAKPTEAVAPAEVKPTEAAPAGAGAADAVRSSIAAMASQRTQRAKDAASRRAAASLARAEADASAASSHSGTAKESAAAAAAGAGPDLDVDAAVREAEEAMDRPEAAAAPVKASAVEASAPPVAHHSAIHHSSWGAIHHSSGAATQGAAAAADKEGTAITIMRRSADKDVYHKAASIVQPNAKPSAPGGLVPTEDEKEEKEKQAAAVPTSSEPGEPPVSAADTDLKVPVAPEAPARPVAASPAAAPRSKEEMAEDRAYRREMAEYRREMDGYKAQLDKESKQVQELEKKLETEEQMDDELGEIPDVEYDHWYPKIDDSPKVQRERHEAEELEDRIAKETNSKGLARMLSRLNIDLYRLREKVNRIHTDMRNGVRIEGPDPAAAMIYPVSVCMQCILMLTMQYFVIYTALAAWKVFVEKFQLGDNTLCELSLRAASETVFYAPMLCVLFLGAEMRATQISEGEHGPPAALELGMQICAWSIFVQMVIVLTIPILSGEVVHVSEQGVKLPGLESRAMAGLLSLVQYTAILAMYAGFTLVCVLTIFMDTRSLGVTPADLWDDPGTIAVEYAPPVSVAMKCTMALTVLFFGVHLLHAALRTCSELTVGDRLLSAVSPRTPRELDDDYIMSKARVAIVAWERILSSTAHSVNVAPMVCILFMAARMRALQIDPKNGRPPQWVEDCFYTCSAFIFVHLLVVFFAEARGIDSKVSEHSPGSIVRGISRVDMNEETDSVSGREMASDLQLSVDTSSERRVIGLRAVALMVIYCSCLGAALGLMEVQAPYGKEAPTMAPSMKCVLILTGLYFAVDMGLFLSQTLAIFCFSSSGAMVQSSLGRAVRTFKMAEYTVKFCPMLAILCIGTRMRALYISHNKGSPQCWAQDSMYLSTSALATQLAVVLIACTLTRKISVDESGSPSSSEITYVPGKVLLEFIRVVSFVALYGGIILIGASVLIIRPDTAQCEWRGYQALF